MSALQVAPIGATVVRNPTVLLEQDVLRAMLEAAWDEGNRRPRRDTNPYRSDDD